MEKTLAQLRQEAEQARNQLAEAEQKAREKEQEIRRVAREQAERQKRLEAYQRNLVHANAIVDELTKLGYEVIIAKPEAYNPSRPVIHSVNNKFSDWDIQFTATTDTYNYNQIKVGGYGGTTYPKRKDGTFSYAKIAEKVHEIVTTKERRQKEYQEDAERYRTNTQIVEKLNEQLGFTSWKSPLSVSGIAGKVNINVKINNLDPDKAESIIKFLIENDIL